MLLMKSLALIAPLVGLVLAQSTTSFDASHVAQETKDQWCLSQTSSCPLLCLQYSNTSSNPKSNTCNSKTLAYTCVCSNGISPNASEYSQTIPYFICTERNNQCVTNCNGDSSCQSDCRTKNPCGAQDPKRVNVTASSTSSVAAATTSLAPFTGVADSGVAAGLSAEMGHVYGLVAVVGAVLAGFTTLL